MTDNVVFNVKIGILYGYNTAQAERFTGKDIFKVGLSTTDGNSRIDSEMNETLSAGKKEIMNVNNNNIPLCFINIPIDKTLKNLENELFKKIQMIGARRIFYGKELFIDISIEQIKKCMEDMIKNYGGKMTTYQNNKVNYFSEPYDEYYIVKGDKYDNSNNKHTKTRANQFIGKQIKEIRFGNTLKRETYYYGGSEMVPRKYCLKDDFEYIIKNKIIKIIKN